MPIEPLVVGLGFVFGGVVVAAGFLASRNACGAPIPDVGLRVAVGVLLGLSSVLFLVQGIDGTVQRVMRPSL